MVRLSRVTKICQENTARRQSCHFQGERCPAHREGMAVSKIRKTVDVGAKTIQTAY